MNRRDLALLHPTTEVIWGQASGPEGLSGLHATSTQLPPTGAPLGRVQGIMATIQVEPFPRQV